MGKDLKVSRGAQCAFLSVPRGNLFEFEPAGVDSKPLGRSEAAQAYPQQVAGRRALRGGVAIRFGPKREPGPPPVQGGDPAYASPPEEA